MRCLPTLLDSTLREGELFKFLTPERKLRVAEVLAELGLRRVEVTVDYPPKTTEADVRPVVELLRDRGVEVVMHGRAYRADVEAFAKYDVDGVAVYVAVSRVHREHKLKGISEEEVMARFLEAAELCRSQGYRYVRATLEDVSRLFVEGQFGELDRLLEFTRELRSAGATMVSLPDTSGLMTPPIAASFVRYCRERSALPIACHFHNDYGMASANTVTAVLEGAEEAHVTLFGIGDRNGIADLYEVVATLHDVHGIDLGVRRERLAWAYAEFSRVAGIRHYWRHPLAPESRTVRAGVHQSMVIKRPDGYIPLGKLRFDFDGVALAPTPYISHKVFLDIASRLNASLDEETARRAAEFVAAHYVANGGKVRFQELKEGLEAVLGLRIPEDLLRAYFGIEKVYIMVKLRPQSDVSRVVSEVSGWQDVEAVDEVYGDMDLVIVGRAASGPNNLVERVRRALLGIAEEMKVLVTD
ncbi:MAG: hypothetical protein RMJ30_06140 [Nitrososphaerota archaeon]|nr:hypothetical protein [Nitrososphaerota archaeon]